MDTESTGGESVADTGAASVSRRQFLSKLTMGMSGIIGALLGIPVVSFLLAPLLERAPQAWQPVATVDTLQIGQTTLVSFQDPSPLPWAGVTSRSAAWLRRESEQQFIAFAVNCTHLGCPVRWLADAKLFMCPCHGGVFYDSGQVAAGPPPRPLFQYETRVRNGQIEIRAGTLPIAAK
jgi:menaquinol-cytochrome c reductase iron-sulfur subunit